MNSVFRSQYLDYAALTAQIRAWTEAHPSLVRAESIGKSALGRDLWVLTIGPEPDRLRPAVWVDGNIHASELCGSSVALGIAEDVIRLHAQSDADMHGLPAHLRQRLREVLFYVMPRMSPDGAEEVLKTGRYVRSVPRDDRPNRSHARWISQDIDGDGSALIMRQVDSGGEFSELGIWMSSGPASVGDIEAAFVGREVDPIRHGQVLDDRLDCSGHRIELEYPMARKFARTGQAPRGIGEPERAVGPHRYVVRRVEPLAVELIREHGDTAVGLRSDEVPAGVLARDKPALQVEYIAVGLRALSKDRQAVAFAPLHEFAVGNVGEDERLLRGNPRRAFSEFHSAGELLHLCTGCGQ